MNKLTLLLSAAIILSSPFTFVGSAWAEKAAAADNAKRGKVDEPKPSAKKEDPKKKEEDKKSEGEEEESVNVSPAKPIPPTLKINGFTLFNTYIIKQSDRSNGKGGAPLHFATDVSDLYFTVAGRAQSVDYMYRINIQSYPGSSPTIDKNYIEIKTDNYGLRMGSTVGPEDFAVYDAGRVIGGAGGFDTGSYANVYNLSAGVIKQNDTLMDTGNAAKIVFMGPDYRGFQFFVAYTPNTAKGGDASKDNHFPDNSSIPGNGGKGIYPEKSMQPYGMNNWAFAVNYKMASGPFNMTLSAAGVTESSYMTLSGTTLQRNKLRNSFAYQLGGLFGYNKWQLGLGYLNSGRARLPTNANMKLNAAGTLTTGNMHQGNSGQAWNAGLGYTIGAYKFAGAYQHFWRKTDGSNKATNNVWTGTIDFNIFQGWKVYFELDVIRSKTNQPMVDFVTAASRIKGGNLTTGVGNNSGTMGIFGTKISF